MKRINNWLDTTLTRRMAMKDLGWCYIIALVITAFMYVIIFWDKIARWSRKKKDQLKKFFKSKTPEERKYQEIKIEEL